MNEIVSEKPEPLSKRGFLEAQAAQGEPDAILELAALPPIPEHGAHLWLWWCELHETRATNGMGPCRLTRHEVRLWEQDEGRTLAMWERKALMAVDAAWVRITSEQMAKRSKKGGKE